MIEWQDLHHSGIIGFRLMYLITTGLRGVVVEQNCPYQDIDGDDLTGDSEPYSRLEK